MEIYRNEQAERSQPDRLAGAYDTATRHKVNGTWGEWSTGWGKWVDLTTARAVNVTYTNDTGRPMQILVSAGPVSGANVYVDIIVDGVEVPGNPSASASTFVNSSSVIIPPGSTHRVEIKNGTATVGLWRELR